MSIQVKMQSKNLKSYVDYNKTSKVIQYGEKNNSVKMTDDFLMKEIRKEVQTLPRKERRQLQQLISKMGNKTKIASMSGLMVATPTMVSAKTDEKIAQEMGLPTIEEIMQMLGVLIEYTIALTFAAGVIWLILSRVYYYMTKKHDKAMESASNSIKGMTQILLATTVVRILLMMAQLLLGGSPNFQLPL